MVVHTLQNSRTWASPPDAVHPFLWVRIITYCRGYSQRILRPIDTANKPLTVVTYDTLPFESKQHAYCLSVIVAFLAYRELLICISILKNKIVINNWILFFISHLVNFIFIDHMLFYW